MRDAGMQMNDVPVKRKPADSASRWTPRASASFERTTGCRLPDGAAFPTGTVAAGSFAPQGHGTASRR